MTVLFDNDILTVTHIPLTVMLSPHSDWFIIFHQVKSEVSELSEPKSLLVDRRVSGVHYFDVCSL